MHHAKLSWMRLALYHTHQPTTDDALAYSFGWSSWLTGSVKPSPRPTAITATTAIAPKSFPPALVPKKFESEDELEEVDRRLISDWEGKMSGAFKSSPSSCVWCWRLLGMVLFVLICSDGHVQRGYLYITFAEN